MVTLRQILSRRSAVVKALWGGLLALLLSGMSATALAVTVSAGPSTCVDIAGPNQTWSNANLAESLDNNYARARLNPGQTNTLQCTGYNFAIPAGAVINGITVTVWRTASNNNCCTDAQMQLVKAGTIQGTDLSTATLYPRNTNTAEAHGSATEKWGNTWTAADINASNFGAAFAAQNTSNRRHNVDVDYIEIAVDYTLPPTVLSINVAGANPTSASSVSWTVTFSASVTGISSSNFKLVNSGLGGTPAITSVTGSGATRTVTASTGTGSGTLGLNMVNTTGVSPALSGLPFTGQVFTIDRAPPTVSSITLVNPSPTALASVSWTVTFSENVTGVDTTDLALVQAGGVSGALITGVTPVSGSVYTVTASTGTGNGTLGLNLVDDDSIIDAAGNPLGGAGAGNGNFSGQIYSVSRPVSVTANPTLCVNDTSIGVATGAWTGLTNVGAQDNVYARASVANSDITNFLKCTGYGFSIPAGATITGITVRPWLNATYTMLDNAMQLVKGGVIQATNLATGTNIPNGGGAFAPAPTQFIYGSSSNLWGNTWTAADINSANFGAAFAAQRGGFATTQQAGVDAMPITVNYTLPAGPTVVSINLASPNPTTPAASVSWTVTFSQSVTGVTASAFALAASGVSGATITSVTGSGTTWTVTANTGSGYGTLGLNQIGPGSVVPTLSGTFTGQVYTVYPPLTCITDNFNAPNNSPPDPANWSVGVVSGSFTPVILGNRLRITDTGGSEATRVTNKNLFPFGNNLVIAEFDYWAYGGSGADGIAITFSDPDTPTFGANDPPTTGGFGGSLGYANRDTGGTCNIPGFSGGWIGVGIDDYGNYSNPTECRNGGPGSLPNAVAIRGSGSGATSPSASNYAYLTGTPALGANGVSSGNSGTPYRYRITLDSITDPTKVMVKVDQDKTGTGTAYAPLFSYDLKSAITAGTQAPLPPRLQFTYTGSTGGSTNYHEVDNLSICAASVIPPGGGLDHLEIQHPSGTGLTCAASTLTVRACADSACSALYTGGVTGTLSATGSPTVNWDGTTGGAAGAGFVIPSGSSSVTKNVQLATAGSVVFGIASPAPAPINATTCNFGSPSCTFTAATAGFIFSNTTTGNTYTIPAQVSGIATPTLYLRAVQTSTTSPAVCTPAIISQTAAVNMTYTCNNPATCQPGNLATLNATPIPSSGGSVSFNFDANGSAPVTLRYDDVGRITFNASITATPFSGGTPITLNGSSNAFVVAPHHFGFSSITPGLIKAGNNFSATVTAYNGLATPTATPNFGKETVPGPEGVTLSFAKYQPSGAGSVNGSFSGGVGAFANGSATGTNLNWSEVGTIDLIATLTSGSYLGSGLTATGTTGTTGAVGRFIPDHFNTYIPSLSGLPMLCPPGLTCPLSYNGFVYSGEPFSVQIVAKNLGNATTQNYNGALGFAKAVTLSAWNAVGAVGVPNQNPGGGTFNNPSVAPAAFSSGVATTSTSNYALPNVTSPTNIYIRAQDTDGVTSLLAVPANSVEGGVGVANGRLRLFNNYGSEDSSLGLRVQAQYWSGKSWVLSSTDAATTIPATSVALSNYRDSTGAPTGAWTTSASGPGTLSGGKGTLTLTAPSPAGKTGCVDVAFNLGTTTQDNSCLANHPAMTAPASSLAWLRGQNGSCAAPADPSASACFGVYSPETSTTIHVRELF
jgi:MSHA biogenesis protein MshQ